MADFDLNSIDDIDYNMDFGFSTVDEDEVQEFESAVQAVECAVKIIKYIEI